MKTSSRKQSGRAVLEQGVLEGRRVFGNIVKYIIPTDTVDADWLTKPRQWTIGKILRFILQFRDARAPRNGKSPPRQKTRRRLRYSAAA